ncbi:MAG: energy-coupled thiamine transporter ThiT [Clostridia bacterium]|nr:energy-coupled thiamine transporter ThiT [Clostridia bacterium]
MNFLFSVAHAEEAAVEASPSWFETAFGDFGDLTIWGWLLLAVLFAGGAALYFSLKKKDAKNTWTTQKLALGAVCIALSSVLSLVKVVEMPQGGSVTAASMLPIIIFAYAYGAGPGLTLGAVYGVLQFILKPYFYSLPQFLLDYPIAFGAIGLAGLFSKSKNTYVGLTLGSIAASLGRLIAAVASGVLFFAEYAPEGMSPIAYSLGYNASYMVPECIVCVVLAIAIGPRLMKELRKIK